MVARRGSGHCIFSRVFKERRGRIWRFAKKARQVPKSQGTLDTQSPSVRRAWIEAGACRQRRGRPVPSLCLTRRQVGVRSRPTTSLPPAATCQRSCVPSLSFFGIKKGMSHEDFLAIALYRNREIFILFLEPLSCKRFARTNFQHKKFEVKIFCFKFFCDNPFGCVEYPLCDIPWRIHI